MATVIIKRKKTKCVPVSRWKRKKKWTCTVYPRRRPAHGPFREISKYQQVVFRPDETRAHYDTRYINTTVIKILRNYCYCCSFFTRYPSAARRRKPTLWNAASAVLHRQDGRPESESYVTICRDCAIFVRRTMSRLYILYYNVVANGFYFFFFTEPVFLKNTVFFSRPR